MPLEAWQPGRTVVAGCVRVRWVRRSRTQSSDVSDRDFLRMATVLAVLDEAESFFISDIRQGLRILLFLCGNSVPSYSCR
jgi:hypothetical protein